MCNQRLAPREFACARLYTMFEIVDEMTSLSPSGLHYTLWKALAENSDLCEMSAAMMTLPFKYGFIHERW